MPNPYRDTLSQEIGYKIDNQTAGCLLFSFVIGLLIAAGIAFVVYWVFHSI
jgi:hypothetical protein